MRKNNNAVSNYAAQGGMGQLAGLAATLRREWAIAHAPPAEDDTIPSNYRDNDRPARNRGRRSRNT